MSSKGDQVDRPHKFTKELLKHWKDLGHVHEASQLPVELAQWNVMTQADHITRDTVIVIIIVIVLFHSISFFLEDWKALVVGSKDGKP